MKKLSCSRCGGEAEPINRMGLILFYFCRPCKLPHDELGRVTIDTARMSPAFNPLSIVRGVVSKTHQDATPLTRSAMETFLLQGLLDAYMAGVKDGVLLAYSQDVTETEPYLQGGSNASNGSVQKNGGNL